jgi:hypothetical protein
VILAPVVSTELLILAAAIARMERYSNFTFIQVQNSLLRCGPHFSAFRIFACAAAEAEYVCQHK